MLIYATDHFVLPLPAGHRFPMRKYARLRERVTGLVPHRMRVPPAATDAELAHAHDPAYIAAVSAGTLDPRAMRRIGFPWSAAPLPRRRDASRAPRLRRGLLRVQRCRGRGHDAALRGPCAPRAHRRPRRPPG